mgnify:CR=1 FL=1
MAEELKPCPFCGGSASIERYGDARQSTIYQCDECGCDVDLVVQLGEEPDCESNTANVCRECIQKAVDLVK